METAIEKREFEAASLVGLNVEEARVIVSGHFDRAIAAAETFDELRRVGEQAEAMRRMFEAASGFLEAQNECAYRKLQIQRALGEMLEPVKAGRPKLYHDGIISRLPEGVSPNQSSRWQQIASVPSAAFEQHAATIRDQGGELTTASVLSLAKSLKVKDGRSGEQETPPLPSDGKFDLLYADPPWRYDFSNSSERAVENHYHTMSLEEIGALPVGDLAAEDCVLFLWATIPKLPEAFDVLEAWGFTYKTAAVWRKSGLGMGYWWRIDCELLLTATRGTPQPPAPTERVSNVIDAAKGRHSEKPEAFRELLESLYPGARRLELFAREPVEGWTCWGNEL